ncbi:YceD family protein [Candidatus Bodocaedibacter vickermanii]|uniref:DUF177 domain-containing protein n=1 Tax=Candidatus Bodocaedibacter vickermanii TaxID=2741701 RepID=A0A7L9RV19_9PROT|nr:DUF177 domain-containing protein [Candidatus Paracaedibacteraceae bacterium 'Lake Konstanz']
MSAIYEIDLSTLPEHETYTLNLSQQLCKDTADRFKIPTVYDIEIEMEIKTEKHFWELSGNVVANVQLKCVKSTELFDAGFQSPFNVILSHTDIDDDTLDVEIITDAKVDIGDLALQYLALQIPLNPVHPKLQTELSDVGDHETAAVVPSWKQALENLKQQK